MSKYQIPESIAALLVYYSLATWLILVSNNRYYLMFRFATCLMVWSCLSVKVWIGATSILCRYEQTRPYLVAPGIAIALIWMSRLRADLQLARQHKRRKRLLKRASDVLNTACQGFLSKIQTDPACCLPEISLDQLSNRITRGARNIQEGDALVTRFFGRYMRLTY